MLYHIYKKIRKKITGRDAIARLKYSPSIIGLFKKANLKIMDIGGRGGASKLFHGFESCMDLSISEPDSVAREDLKKILKKEGWRKAIVIPEAIFSKEGEATLYITRQPGLSSLLESDRDSLSLFNVAHSKFDIVGEEKVRIISLDNAASRYDCKDVAFLKIDTQGTELDILKSGKEMLHSVVVIAIESEFVSLYKNQSLFSDVHAFLTEKGFRLIEIEPKRRGRGGFAFKKSKKEIMWADCLYVRDKNNDGSELSSLQKIRLGSLMMLYGYFSFALFLLKDNVDNILYESLKKDIENF
ncbi:MAG: hypothetical protein COU47_00850 [Candidatus Niyogibacteria bacterium CG10_big_fil_rev_8_21_14_0_10_46_36]|uniref:Methyltransferase FkbM domain-containing protein n=1 Tax=Candidatus Niyogibacteria bacterium CG10_big_fil_rev_8_21_14_0_10_46_36 TaxID=1974726 RepID=A0A2H0TEJ4_9BACT|nr:MAG: hypothetical protein COU47_00850 [Candidatus Niyogibacteria bacterium CG10_big_fil_rev_8_21_14_0_10_46_36]